MITVWEKPLWTAFIKMGGPPYPKEKYRWKNYGGYHPIVWILILGDGDHPDRSFMSLPFLVIHLSENLGIDSLSVGLTLGAAGLTGALGALSEVICLTAGGAD